LLSRCDVQYHIHYITGGEYLSRWLSAKARCMECG
jgi:hypothetical protein